MNFSAVILAGGQSRRMGRDKALLLFEGRSLLARQAELLNRLGPEEIFVSASARGVYESVGYPVIADAAAGVGPLMGILTALRAVRTPMVLILAVDMPLMTVGLLEALRTQATEKTGVVPHVNGRVEPLVAFYPKQAAKVAVRMMRYRLHTTRAFVENCRRERLVRIHRIDGSYSACFTSWDFPDDCRVPTHSDAEPRAGSSGPPASV